MEERSYAFFQNRACVYFPCHEGVREEAFNCLFCYCPLYALGEACGGKCAFTDKGIKSCENCSFPHQKENYNEVLRRAQAVLELAVRRFPERGDGHGV